MEPLIAGECCAWKEGFALLRVKYKHFTVECAGRFPLLGGGTFHGWM